MPYDPTLMGPPNVRTMSNDEHDDYIVMRDGATQGAEYTRNALERAAALLDKQAEALPYGYHRHWNRVDAQVLRNIAAAK